MRPEYDADPPNPFGLGNPAILDIAPPEPKSLEETGLKMGLLSDIALRYLYYQGTATGMDIAQELRLPWPGVIEAVVEHLDVKRAIFRQLESTQPATAVLATNTSSLSIDDIVEQADTGHDAALHACGGGGGCTRALGSDHRSSRRLKLAVAIVVGQQ